MEFVEKYGHPKWTVEYRGGADLTTRFGLDDTFRDKDRPLRIHAATDRGSGTVKLPFDASSVSYKPWGGGFGALLFLTIDEGGFEMRIAHMSESDLSQTVKDAISKNEGLKAGTVLGQAGAFGVVTGRHTHTEIVSLSNRSQELDWLMHYWGKHLNMDPTRDIDYRDVIEWAEARNLDSGRCLNLYTEERSRRGVLQLNDLRCVRMDYKTGYRDKKTFYNSWILFNGV